MEARRRSGVGSELGSDRPFEVNVTAERELDRPPHLTCLVTRRDSRLRRCGPAVAHNGTDEDSDGEQSDDGESEFHGSMHDERPAALHDSRALTRIAEGPGIEPDPSTSCATWEGPSAWRLRLRADRPS